MKTFLKGLDGLQRQLERKRDQYAEAGQQALQEAVAEIQSQSDLRSGGLAGASRVTTNGTTVTLAYPDPKSKMVHESFDEVYSPTSPSKFLEGTLRQSTERVRELIVEAMRRAGD